MAKTVLKLKKNLYMGDIIKYNFVSPSHTVNATDIYAKRGESFVRRFNYDNSYSKYVFIVKNLRDNLYSYKSSINCSACQKKWQKN